MNFSSWHKCKASFVDIRDKNNSGVFERVLIISFICLILLFMLLKMFVYSSVIVSQTSMTPTLQDGNVLVVNRLRAPQRGDVVVFYGGSVDDNGNITYEYDSYGNKILYVKRLIADSCDTIYWEHGVVYLRYEDANGSYYVELKEPYTTEKTYTYYTFGDNTKGIYVPEGEMFVMGDNRDGSHDSRSEMSTIDKRMLLGVVPEFVVQNKDKWFSVFFRVF